MEKQERYANVLENYFVERELTLDALKLIVKDTAPVFGELKTEISKTENGTKIVFEDEEVYDRVMNPDGEVVEAKIDMSCHCLTVNLNDEMVVTVLEKHGFGLFTPANKEQVLVFTSLIGKKIIM